MAVDEGSSSGLGAITSSSVRSSASASASTPIDSSNIGFQLLKKHGWKEGTGLGVSEQGRLEPVQACVKKNKRGLGADQPKKAIKDSKIPNDDAQKMAKTKGEKMSKRMKKMQEHEKQLQDKEFERALFRAFWPDNV